MAKPTFIYESETSNSNTSESDPRCNFRNKILRNHKKMYKNEPLN